MHAIPSLLIYFNSVLVVKKWYSYLFNVEYLLMYYDSGSKYQWKGNMDKTVEFLENIYKENNTNYEEYITNITVDTNEIRRKNH